jgi:hypothetical protein
MAMPLLMIGFFISMGPGSFGNILILVGIALFSVTVLFQLFTLPVEFNASRRAMDMLHRHDIIDRTEAAPARKVLNAAALTYVAAALSAILSLIRLILIARRRR